ncbi:hypothetical protein BBP40_009471 [Aspergillus hancockii]|nr:hypothetical protein BBP40_009471 [Aspergillus hancockii]
MGISNPISAQGKSQAVPLNPIRGWQTTFPVIEGQYHQRRSHQKSRNGCTTCKRRRVKASGLCDERQPTCHRCQKYGALCAYNSPSSGSSSLSPTGNPQQLRIDQPSGTTLARSVAQMITKLSEGFKGDLAWITGDPDTAFSIAVAAFNQFLDSTSQGSLGTLRIRDVMRTDMIHVACGTPYLMYTILAAGALRINRTCPGNKIGELAEAYFSQRAVVLFQAALQFGLTQKSIDGLISACMILGLLSLYPPSFSAPESWVFTGEPGDLNWLCLQGGLTCLIAEAGPLLQHCIWADPFAHSDEWEGKLCQYDLQQSHFHEALASLCGINKVSTTTTATTTNPYYNAVKLLSPLLMLDATAENAALAATWIGRLEHQFVALLRQRDRRALVVLAHWMGLLCTLSRFEPWVEGRVRQECIAICMYLENLRDPAIRLFLEYPASSCGYTLLGKL